MAYNKVKVDCLHPYAIQQIRDVLSGNPTTKGYGGKYPDVEGFSDFALKQIQGAVTSAMSLDINAGYVMAFVALTGVDEQDPTDLSKVKVTYLGYTDFKTTKTITVDQIAATKMLTLATLTGESLFMSVLGTLFKDVPADVLSQLTVGTEYGISDIEDLTKCAVNTPVPAVCENGADGSYDGCRFKVGGTWDEHNTPLVVRMFYSDAALGGKPVNLVLIDFWDMYNSIASRFSTKPDTMRILFDTPSNKDGYNYSTVYVDMPYVTLSAE